MKIALLIGSMLIGSTGSAAESFVQRVCYSACTFDGLKAAERTCATVQQSVHIMSNEKVQLVAVCRNDRDGQYCGSSPYCIFPSVILETKFIVH